MAQPTPYDRQSSFALFTAQNPGEPHTGTSLDQEFSAVKVTLDETLDNLALIQDDDGALARGSVGRPQLGPSITLGFDAPALWVADTLYDADASTVFHLSKFYICIETHTSAVTFDASKWSEIADFTLAAILEDGSITEDKLDSEAVTTSKLGSGAVTAAKLASSSVTTSKLATGAVTFEKVATADLPQLADALIVSGQTKATALLSTDIATGAKFYLSGYTTAGVGAAIWQSTPSEPTHTAKFGPLMNGEWAELVGWHGYITPEMVGAVGDGTTDDKLALQAFASHPCLDKRLAAKHYKTSGVVDCVVGTCLVGVAGTSKITGIAGGTGAGFTVAVGKAVVNCAGSLVALPALDTSPAQRAISLSFDSAPSVSPGDVVVIYDPTDGSWHGVRTYYRQGEMCLARSVSGTAVGVRDPLYSGYTASSVDTYVIPRASFTIGGVELVAPGDHGVMALNVSLLTKVDFLPGFAAHGADNQTIQLDRCYDVDGRGLVASCRGANTANQYAVVISNCHDVDLHGSFESTRHGIAVGGNDFTGCVVNRRIVLSGRFVGTDDGQGADVHGNAEDVTYKDCEIFNGAGFGGKDVKYVNCDIYGRSTGFAAGACVYASEVYGGQLALINCRLHTNGNPASIGRGVIDFGGNSFPIDANTQTDVTFLFENLTIVAPNAADALIRGSASASAVPVNIHINGLIVKAASITQLLRMDGFNATVASDFICVRNVHELPSGVLLLADANITDGSTVIVMPEQTVVQTVQATAGNASPATHAGTNWKWPYPRVPVVTISTAGSTQYSGSKKVVADIYTVTAAAVRSGIFTPDAAVWPSSVTATAHVTARMAHGV